MDSFLLYGHRRTHTKPGPAGVRRTATSAADYEKTGTLVGRMSTAELVLEAASGEQNRVVLAELSNIASSIKRGEPTQRVPVRKLLGWFNAQRRGFYVVQKIREELNKLGIETVPDFNEVWIDSEVEFQLAVPKTEQQILETDQNPQSGAPDGISGTPSVSESALVGGAVVDPTYRIGKLEAANKKVVSALPTDSLEQAITLMLANGFSQLPVMQGERDVKGVISWETIGARLALGRNCREVRDFMSTPQVIGSERSLFAAIEVIAQYQYVLVQAPDRRITGIVTAADLSRQYHQLSEPFLLLGEIEQHIRRMIVGKFTPDELKLACDRNDSGREIQSVADLTMGEYIRVLENPSHWGKIGLRIDRATFVEQLQTVRRIRNEVMHFDPDPLSPDDLVSLRQFSAFMQSLRELGVVQ
jgi:CBS domain-containing protein